MTPDEIAAITDEAAEAAREPIEAALTDAMAAAVDQYEATRQMLVPADHAAAIAEVLQTSLNGPISTVGAAVLLTLRKQDESLFEQVVAEYMRQYGALRVTQIAETTMLQLRGLVASGAAEGLTVDEIARSIRDQVPQIARVRSAVIARTETHSGSQFAGQQIARTVAPTTAVKRWNTVQDARARSPLNPENPAMFDHVAMNGVEVGLDTPFRVPMANGLTEALMFPGDPKGSAGNVIQCRCVATYRIT